MDLGTLIRILVKRWFVVLPLLAITLVAALQIGRSIDPDYATRGSVLLIGPNTAGDSEVNPLAELRSPLNTTALAIGIIAVDEQTRTEVRELGFEGTYAVDVTPNTPIINIRVLAASPEQALLTLEAVIDAVVLKLDERQRGVEAPENSLIQGETLTKTTTARAIFGSRDRAVAGIMAVGLVAAAAAAVLVDAYIERADSDEVEEEDSNIAALHGDAGAPEVAREPRRWGRTNRTSADSGSPPGKDEDQKVAPQPLSERQIRKARRQHEKGIERARKASEKKAKQARKNIKKSTVEARKAIESTSNMSRGDRRQAQKARKANETRSVADARKNTGAKDKSADAKGKNSAGGKGKTKNVDDRSKLADDIPDDDGQAESASAEGL